MPWPGAKTEIEFGSYTEAHMGPTLENMYECAVKILRFLIYHCGRNTPNTTSLIAYIFD